MDTKAPTTRRGLLKKLGIGGAALVALSELRQAGAFGCGTVYQSYHISPCQDRERACQRSCATGQAINCGAWYTVPGVNNCAYYGLGPHCCG